MLCIYDDDHTVMASCCGGRNYINLLSGLDLYFRLKMKPYMSLGVNVGRERERECDGKGEAIDFGRVPT